MKKIIVVVAGGSGSRMKAVEPKQFLVIAGRPVLMHTLAVFPSFDPLSEIFLVLPETQREYWDDLCRIYNFRIPHTVINGGKTRFHSVQNGLAAIPDEGIVFIHDGVRPLVKPETLQRCYKKALQAGNAVPVIPVSESVRKIENHRSFSVDRSRLVLIQTPQTFRIPLIRQAYRQDYTPEFTDDASVIEKSGETIHLVEGNRENIKITWPEDLLYAESVLAKVSFFHP